MANQTEVSIVTKAAWDRLAQRQELILSQLEQLTSRVDGIGQKHGTQSSSSLNNGEITVVTSQNGPQLNDMPSSTRRTHTSHHHKTRMTSKDLAKLNESQNDMFDRLLNVAHNIDQLSKQQNIQLPETMNVENSMEPIINMIDDRLTRITSKGQFLIDLINQPTIKRPEATPDSVRSQGTPVFRSRPRKLSSAGLEPMQILPFHNQPKETESEEYSRRMNELEYSVNHMRSMIISSYDKSKEGFVNAKDIYQVLSNMNLEMNLQQVMHSRHITIITKLLLNDKNNKVNYNDLCNLMLDINKTDRSDHKHEWHHFRRTLIGVERKEGCLRILYRFDGWPYPLTTRLFHSLDTTKNQVFPKDIAIVIQRATKEHVEFEKIAYAEKSKHGTGKTRWVKIANEDAIPLHVERDGWLEVDVWLKTKEFLSKRPGRALPKYA